MCVRECTRTLPEPLHFESRFTVVAYQFSPPSARGGTHRARGAARARGARTKKSAAGSRTKDLRGRAIFVRSAPRHEGVHHTSHMHHRRPEISPSLHCRTSRGRASVVLATCSRTRSARRAGCALTRRCCCRRRRRAQPVDGGAGPEARARTRRGSARTRAGIATNQPMDLGISRADGDSAACGTRVRGSARGVRTLRRVATRRAEMRAAAERQQ